METIFPLRETLEALFKSYPQSPQAAHEGGESPTPFPNLSLRIEVPFSGIVTLPYSDPSWSTVRYEFYPSKTIPKI